VERLARSLEPAYLNSNVKITLYNLDENTAGIREAKYYGVTMVSSMVVIRGSDVHVFSVDGLSDSQILALINTPPALLSVLDRFEAFRSFQTRWPQIMNATQFS
jgi:hypothetical protein